VGIAQPSASGLENSEERGGVTLQSMERAAQAMDCRFVYFFTPNHGSFDALLEIRI